MTYEIETEDAYKDFWSDKDKFDNSEYPENSPYFDKSNKNVIGKFKDEESGIPINEFMGLRIKMYSYLKDADECGKTATGIKKNVMKKDIKDVQRWQFLTTEAAESLCMVCLPPEEHIFTKNWVKDLSKSHIL